ncbi:hypothetical protein B5M09_011704 [Aphanomyces astaci]|uniref:DDE Tnp4 domain-containing protein n=1 Tax=Aphanomyces astaci TaxID=112090 RepID=A0A3R7Z5M1_APHAT|nr:hypothetical protein B5M09_011704 [Aphanomyces astaci]
MTLSLRPKEQTDRVSDKAIFDYNLEFHVSDLSKEATEDCIADHGEEATNQWAVIADKGYQGIQRVVRALLPKKKPAGGILTLEDVRSNDSIASDRVIVENVFGRMKKLWAVCGEAYRWSRDKYDVLFQTCMALINVHIRLHPLRADDGVVYSQYINRMSSIGSKKDKGKKTSSRTYRTKRKARLTLMLAAESSLVARSAVGASQFDLDLGSNSDAEYGSNLLF